MGNEGRWCGVGGRGPIEIGPGEEVAAGAGILHECGVTGQLRGDGLLEIGGETFIETPRDAPARRIPRRHVSQRMAQRILRCQRREPAECGQIDREVTGNGVGENVARFRFGPE
jgi:hypothetical protein